MTLDVETPGEDVRLARDALSRAGARDDATARAFFALAWRCGWGLGDPLLQFPGPATHWLFAPDGERVAVATPRDGVFCFEVATGAGLGRVARGLGVHRLALDPGGAGLWALATRAEGDGLLLHHTTFDGQPDPAPRLLLTPGVARPRVLDVFEGFGRILVEGDGPSLGVLEVASAAFRHLPHPGATLHISRSVACARGPGLLLCCPHPELPENVRDRWYLGDLEAGTLRDLDLGTEGEAEWSWSPELRWLAVRSVEESGDDEPYRAYDPGGALFLPYITILDLVAGTRRRRTDSGTHRGPMAWASGGRMAGEPDPPAPLEPNVFFDLVRPVVPMEPLASFAHRDGLRAYGQNEPAHPFAAGHANSIEALWVTGEGAGLVTRCAGDQLVLWSLDTGLPLTRTSSGMDQTWFAAGPGATWVLELRLDSFLLRTGESLTPHPRRTVPVAAEGRIEAVAPSRDGDRYLLATSDGQLLVGRPTPQTRLQHVAALGAGVAACGWLASQKLLFALLAGGELLVLEARDGSVVKRFTCGGSAWSAPARWGAAWQALAHPHQEAVVVRSGDEALVYALDRSAPSPLFADAVPVARVALELHRPRAARALRDGGLEVRALGTNDLVASVSRDLGEVRAMEFVPGRDLLLYAQGAHVRRLDLPPTPHRVAAPAPAKRARSKAR